MLFLMSQGILCKQLIISVKNLHCILLLHITHFSKVNCTLDKVNCTFCVRKHTILGPAYLFILCMSNTFVANAMKSTTNNIGPNLSNKIISKHACRFLCYCYCKTLCQISIVAYSITLTDMHVDMCMYSTPYTAQLY